MSGLIKNHLTASEYFERRFGGKVYKLALSCSSTCPNRDGRVGTRGCLFCSEGGSGEFAESEGSVDEMIERAKLRVASKIKTNKFIAYFQRYTSTYAPFERLESFFTKAIRREDVVALSVATRPDCLPENVLDLLERLNKIKPVFVELGLQTVSEQTAKLIRRGYDLGVYDEAVGALHARGINVITHVILGLPGESREDMFRTVAYVGERTDGIKLQLLHVLRGTDLEKMYERGEFETLTLEEYGEILAGCLDVLPLRVVVHRLTGDAPKRLLVAPKWSGDKKRVLNFLAHR